MFRAEGKKSRCLAPKSAVPSLRNQIVVNVFRGPVVVGRQTEEVQEELVEVVVVVAASKAAFVAADGVASMRRVQPTAGAVRSATRIESGLFCEAQAGCSICV